MPHAEDNFGFSRNSRIKSSLIIKQLVDSRKSIFAYPLKCYYDFVPTETPAPPALAVVVPKKRFKHAVDRNRLKRLMREAFRLNRSASLQQLTPSVQLQMCWIFVGKELADQETVSQAATSIMQKLCQMNADSQE